MRHFTIGVLATSLSILLTATTVLARPASTLTDINGSSGSSAQNQLEQRGFTFIANHKNSQGYVYSYWWNQADKNCVQAESYNGTVMTISDAKPADCNHSAANSAGQAGGRSIMGEGPTSRSHHRQGRDYNAQQLAEFERGYKDGLHNASYHNHSKSDAYAHGYEQGVDERKANLAHHHNRGGYAQVAEYKDLKGARSAGAMEELQRRGFTQVDNGVSGNDRYSVQWRSASHQCVQAIISDGHIYDIRDIETHPKCR